ncbi:MAG: ketoacyl-ACP synthase III [Candidatus Delongbacteria bacterium]|nr:ketoacyl-ACP synthase III [Candidatus Delongbacteria bacterium]MBN2835676.1 ketoacyl-ACP synthase III [Candidatus Delongbacteria bacterium]
MKSAILGTGYYVPENIVTNFDLEKLMDTNDEWITSRTGIKERRIASKEEMNSDLAVKAAERAILSSGLKNSDIDCVILATITGDYIWPATSCEVINKLGINGIMAFDISAACSGFVYALSIAKSYIEAGFKKNVLVIGVEKFSSTLNWNDRNTSILFADGAGAVVVGESDGVSEILEFSIGASGEKFKSLYVSAGGSNNPLSNEALENKENFIYMDGKEIFRNAVKIMPAELDKAIEKSNLKIEDIDYFIFHQANLRIIQSIAKRYGVNDEKVIINVNKYGNTSAATIPIALAEAFENGRIKKGDIVGMSAFGAGLTWGACVVKI